MKIASKHACIFCIFVTIIALFYGYAKYCDFLISPKIFNNLEIISQTKNKVDQLISYLSEEHGQVQDNCTLFKEHTTLSSESLNSSSPLYGLTHSDTYGLPLSCFGLQSFEQKTENWEIYFPNLIKSIEKYNSENPTKKSSAFSNPLTSSIYFDSSKIYKIGEIFKARIEVKDRLNRSKIFGGDYFRATLVTDARNKKTKNGIACSVEDHMNGSYSLSAPILFDGTVTLKVNLVMSVEGIAALIDWLSWPIIKKSAYAAVLKSGETVACNLDLPYIKEYRNRKVCDYSNPRNKEPWICVMPPSDTCPPITLTDSGPSNVEYLNGYKNFQEIHAYSKPIVGSGVKFTVKKKSDDVSAKKLSDIHINHNITGFIRDFKWTPFMIKRPIKSLKGSVKCFYNKSIYILGDSTMRQFFELVTSTLNLTVESPTRHRQQAKIGRDSLSNITLHYRSHGPPLRNHGSPSSKPYISDIIDDIKLGGPEVYIIFNVGLHLLRYETSLYVRRMKTIKRAIIDHLAQFPDTRIIVKGMNVVDRFDEWLLKRYDDILKQLFAGIRNVFFVNLWDMTTVWPFA